MTWQEAREACQSFEGDLVSIHSKEENMMVHSYISSAYISAWIGLSLVDEGNSNKNVFNSNEFIIQVSHAIRGGNIPLKIQIREYQNQSFSIKNPF